MQLPFLVHDRIAGIFEPVNQPTFGRSVKFEGASKSKIYISIVINIMRCNIDISLGGCSDWIFFPARVFIPVKLSRISR